MRDAKFRIWDIEVGQFYYWSIIDHRPFCLTAEYIQESAEQFTGLRDSTGREIYEGDTVEYSDDTYCKRYNVELGNFSFDGGHCRYQYQGFGLVPIGSDDHEDHWRLIEGEIKVVGNIHEPAPNHCQ